MSDWIKKDILDYLLVQETAIDLQELIESIGHEPTRATKALIALLEIGDVQIIVSHKAIKDQINAHLIELDAKQVDYPNESDETSPRS